MNPLWIVGRRVVLPSGVAPAAIEMRAGRIESIRPEPPPGAEALDVGSSVISPGLVDCHVHINEPGRTEWEGFDTATKAAAAGGVTSLVDMPLNCIPVTTSREALEQKRRACRGSCHVDVGFWGGVVPGNAEQLPGLAQGGVLGCKAFLVHSGIDEFPNATEPDLRAAMPVLRDHGLPLLAHAELDLGAEVTEADPQSYRAFLQSRPPRWEDEAIALLVRLCRETGCHVHIVHLSSASSLSTLRAAKEEGLPLSVETCPHYLCLEAEAVPRGATEFKCAPPIRESENREALWQGLFDGVIDFVITDHSPCTPGLKLRESGNFHDAWGGISSLSLGLCAVWTEARRRGATLEQLSGWMSREPARFAGLSSDKGEIAVGKHADLVVWDPEVPVRVTADRLHFRHKVSPYLGTQLFGSVRRTFCRGREVFDGSGHPELAAGGLLLGRSEPPRATAAPLFSSRTRSEAL